MSDFSACQHLLEKHVPSVAPSLLTASEVRRAIIRSSVISGRPAPDHIVQLLHSRYLMHKSVRKVAKEYGMHRNSVRTILRRNKTHVVQPNQQPTRIWNGRKYALKSDLTCWRRTTRKQQHISLHRDVWEKTNGAIPFGMCIVALDGDNIHVRLSNLRMMTRPEYMKHLTGLRKNNLRGIAPG